MFFKDNEISFYRIRVKSLWGVVSQNLLNIIWKKFYVLWVSPLPLENDMFCGISGRAVEGGAWPPIFLPRPPPKSPGQVVNNPCLPRPGPPQCLDID